MNPYELLAREKKAAKLAAAIRTVSPNGGADLDIALIACLPPSAPFWKAAAELAEVPPPSAATCAATVEILKGKP